MREISDKELKQLQLDILKAIHIFCSEHHINYSLAFGTLLGAIRHGGFIPWDDDIDIMMPREDYNIFIRTFRHHRYKVFSAPETKGYYITYAKVIDEKTDLTEFSAQKLHMGVNVDIFPLDNYSKDLDDTTGWWSRKQMIDKIYNFKILPFSIKFLIRHPRTAIYKLFYEIRYPFKSLRKLAVHIQYMSTLFNNQSCNKVGVLSVPWFKFTYIFPKKILNDYINVEFEGFAFKCIKNYEYYLTLTYGEWQKLPPVEEQITHHNFKAFWK